jgi:uncharacterized protein (DUF488 family)
MEKPVLCTIGYAGLDDESFLAKLRLNGIQALVDVRDRPFSRNRHFNQARLKGFLEADGIDYLSLRELGVPADLRKKHREEGGGLNAYLDAYRKLLGGKEAAMSVVSSLIEVKTCCLLCLEHEPSECHRSVLAEELAIRHSVPLKVVHIQ